MLAGVHICSSLKEIVTSMTGGKECMSERCVCPLLHDRWLYKAFFALSSASVSCVLWLGI